MIIVYVTGFSYPFTAIAYTNNFIISCFPADDTRSHIKKKKHLDDCNRVTDSVSENRFKVLRRLKTVDQAMASHPRHSPQPWKINSIQLLHVTSAVKHNYDASFSIDSFRVSPLISLFYITSHVKFSILAAILMDILELYKLSQQQNSQ